MDEKPDIEKLYSKDDKNNNYWLFLTFFCCLIVGAIAFGFYQMKKTDDITTSVENGYLKSFYEAVEYVDNVDLFLDKIRLAKQPQQNILIFAELWKQADSAKITLSQLPYNHQIVYDMLKFLSQVSDFSYYGLNKTSRGEPLNNEDWESLKTIREYSLTLSSELNNTLASLNQTNIINWSLIQSEEAADEDGVVPESITGSMINVSKEFKEYPSLIYDGPYSEHIISLEPRLLKDKKEVTKDEGIKIVENFLRNEKITDITFNYETNIDVKGVIPSYTYDVLLADEKDPTLQVSVSKQGGFVLWMLNFTEIPFAGQFIEVEQAIQSADNFLVQNNYPNMKNSYYEINQDSVVINYAPIQDGIILYPDLVKVKVSMIDGSIIGFESMGYISMHYDRDMPAEIITYEQAGQYLSEEFEIEKISLAIIPKSSRSETLCYEFTGNFDDSGYIIYINAQNGIQEKIWKLLITENGTMTE